MAGLLMPAKVTQILCFNKDLNRGDRILMLCDEDYEEDTVTSKNTSEAHLQPVFDDDENFVDFQPSQRKTAFMQNYIYSG